MADLVQKITFENGLYKCGDKIMNDKSFTAHMDPLGLKKDSIEITLSDEDDVFYVLTIKYRAGYSTACGLAVSLMKPYGRIVGDGVTYPAIEVSLETWDCSQDAKTLPFVRIRGTWVEESLYKLKTFAGGKKCLLLTS